jgi:hypothetical protein
MAIYDNHYVGIMNTMQIEAIRKGLHGEKYAPYFRNKELRDMIIDENPDLEAILVMYEFKDSW